MSQRHDSPQETLRERQWFATLAFTVIFIQSFSICGFNLAVSAKPLPRSSVSTNSVTSSSSLERISPPPVDAVLANVRSKPGSQSKVRKTVVPAARSNRTIVTNQHDDANRSLRGISHLIDTQRNTNVAPVNRLIDR
jgi:hypothetical protein